MRRLLKEVRLPSANSALLAGLLALALAAHVAGMRAPESHPDSSTTRLSLPKSRTDPDGRFHWDMTNQATGEVTLTIDLERQRLVVRRSDQEIASSRVSTGKEGFETPRGRFSILQKNVEHYSNRYAAAPMPFMQRLTDDGVALHAGLVPWYPASRGCVRLPGAFAEFLFSITTLGTEVHIL